MKYRVTIRIKDGVLDPEMETLQRLLQRSGVKTIRRLSHQQIYDIEFGHDVNETEAAGVAQTVAGDVLANPEIHDWTVEQA